MAEEQFRRYLRRGGRSAAATERAIRFVEEFSLYLGDRRGIGPDEATADDLETFVAWVEREPKSSAKTQLWALRYYYDYRGNEEMAALASRLRQQRIQRKPLPLKDFRGVRPEYIEALEAVGIHDVKQMIEAGATPADRLALAEQTGLPEAVILEMVNLSDLARIAGLKNIRARLYHDAGLDTLDRISQCAPEEVRKRLAAFIEETGFDGIPPTPGEAKSAVAQAHRLPRLVSY